MTKPAMLQVDQVDVHTLNDNQLHIPGEERRPNRSKGKPRSGYVHHPHHHHHRRLYNQPQEEQPNRQTAPAIVHAVPVIEHVEPPTPADPLSLNDPFEKHFLAAAALQAPAEKPARSSSFREDKPKPVVQKRRDSDGNYSSSPNLLFPNNDLQVDSGQSGDAPLRRVRSFKTTSKGTILNRGDSFRKKSSNRNLASGSTVEKGRDSPRLESGGISVPDVQVTTHRDALPSYFKVQILGALGCGKTSIANQFMSSDFANAFESMNVDDVERTVTIQLDGDEFTMEFLDAPEEEDHDDNDIELTADSYVVVYSITDKNSFDVAVQILYRLRHCMDSDRPIVLVGNKADLVRKRKVKKEEVISISKTYDCLHYETSAALNHHVDELLVAILKQIRHKLDPDVYPLAPEQACEVKKVSKGPMDFFVRLFRKMSGKGGSERK